MQPLARDRDRLLSRLRPCPEPGIVSESTPEEHAPGDGQQSPYLADARQRLDWADRDGEAFDGASRWFAQPEAYAIRTQRNGERWESTFHRWITVELEAEKLTELARILGSFLDHVRAGLDYAAYQLAQLALRKGVGVKGLNPEAVEFPIFRTSNDFRQKNRVKKLPDEYRDFIEAKQPYEGRDPSLWRLQEIAREYRHSVVPIRAIAPIEHAHDVLVNGEPIPISDVEIIPHESLEQGEVILRFSLPAGIDPDAEVYPDVAATAGIDHPLCSGVAGTRILEGIMQAAGALFLDIEERFFID